MTRELAIALDLVNEVEECAFCGGPVEDGECQRPRCMANIDTIPPPSGSLYRLPQSGVFEVTQTEQITLRKLMRRRRRRRPF